MEYSLGLKIDNYYFVRIKDELEDKVMVHEDDINGFIQCLEYLGYKEE